MDNLSLTNLPEDIRKTWRAQLDDVIKKLEEKTVSNDVLERSRKTLKAALNTINRSLDSSFLELYMVKINNVSQIIMALLLIALFFIYYRQNGSTDYFYACVLGALGGSLSSNNVFRQTEFDKGKLYHKPDIKRFCTSNYGCGHGPCNTPLGRESAALRDNKNGRK